MNLITLGSIKGFEKRLRCSRTFLYKTCGSGTIYRDSKTPHTMLEHLPSLE